MNYILAAILSNLSYAFADNANGLISRKNNPLKVAFWACLFGILIFFLPMLLFFSHELHRLTLNNLVEMLMINILGSIGYLSFITGMSRGSVTLTGVVGGSFPAITTLAALIFFGERVSALQLVAILAIVVGVALSSMSGAANHLLKDLRSSGAIFAFGAFFLWGIYFALIRIPVEKLVGSYPSTHLVMSGC